MIIKQAQLPSPIGDYQEWQREITRLLDLPSNEKTAFLTRHEVDALQAKCRRVFTISFRCGRIRHGAVLNHTCTRQPFQDHAEHCSFWDGRLLITQPYQDEPYPEEVEYYEHQNLTILDLRAWAYYYPGHASCWGIWYPKGWKVLPELHLLANLLNRKGNGGDPAAADLL